MTIEALAWELCILMERGLTKRSFPETTVKHYQRKNRRERGSIR